MTITWPTILWGAAGAAALVRAFWHPARHVTTGAPLGCPGVACDPSVTLGPGALFAVTSGRVYAAAPGMLQVASSVEPVLVTYQGSGVQPAVSVGASVRLGQALGGSSGPFSFAVQQVQPGGKLSAIEPASWLAARGLKLSPAASPLWCAQGRKILVPRAVASCGLRLPDPSSVMLLPVSTTTE